MAQSSIVGVFDHSSTKNLGSPGLRGDLEESAEKCDIKLLEGSSGQNNLSCQNAKSEGSEDKQEEQTTDLRSILDSFLEPACRSPSPSSKVLNGPSSDDLLENATCVNNGTNHTTRSDDYNASLPGLSVTDPSADAQLASEALSAVVPSPRSPSFTPAHTDNGNNLVGAKIVRCDTEDGTTLKGGQTVEDANVGSPQVTTEDLNNVVMTSGNRSAQPHNDSEMKAKSEKGLVGGPALKSNPESPSHEIAESKSMDSTASTPIQDQSNDSITLDVDVIIEDEQNGCPKEGVKLIEQSGNKLTVNNRGSAGESNQKTINEIASSLMNQHAQSAVPSKTLIDSHFDSESKRSAFLDNAIEGLSSGLSSSIKRSPDLKLMELMEERIKSELVAVVPNPRSTLRKLTPLLNIPDTMFLPPSTVCPIMSVKEKPVVSNDQKPEPDAVVVRRRASQRLQVYPCPFMTELIMEIGENLVLEHHTGDELERINRETQAAHHKWKQAQRKCHPTTEDSDEGDSAGNEKQLAANRSKELERAEAEFKKIKTQRQRYKDVFKMLKSRNTPYKTTFSRCTRCNFKSDSASILYDHKLTPHKRHNHFECSFCSSFRSTDWEEMMEHYQEVHSVPCRQIESVPKYSCNLCDRSDFHYKSVLMSHVRSCNSSCNPRKNLAPVEDHLLHINRLLWNLSNPQLEQVQLKMSLFSQKIQPVQSLHIPATSIVMGTNPVSASNVWSQAPPGVGMRNVVHPASASFSSTGGRIPSPISMAKKSIGFSPAGMGASSLVQTKRLRQPGGLHLDHGPLSANSAWGSSAALQPTHRAATSQFPLAIQPKFSSASGTSASSTPGAYSLFKDTAGTTISRGSSQQNFPFRGQHPRFSVESKNTMLRGNSIGAGSMGVGRFPLASGSNAVSGSSKMSKEVMPRKDGLLNGSSALTPQQRMCEICDSVFPTVLFYISHLQTAHGKLRGINPIHLVAAAPLPCLKCSNRRFYSYEGLERHLLSSHGLISQELLQKVHQKKDGGRCKLCSVYFAFNLVQHTAAAHNVQLCTADFLYTCDICHARFGMCSLLEAHLTTSHFKQLQQPRGGRPTGLPFSQNSRPNFALARPSASSSSFRPSTPAVPIRGPPGGMLRQSGPASLSPNPHGMVHQPPRFRALPPAGPPRIRYNCTPCQLKFVEYGDVINHWKQKHLKPLKVDVCRIEKCEPCQKKRRLELIEGDDVYKVADDVIVLD